MSDDEEVNHFEEARKLIQARREHQEEVPDESKEEKLARIKRSIVMSSSEAVSEITGKGDPIEELARSITFEGIDFHLVRMRSQKDRELYGKTAVEFTFRDSNGNLVGVTRREADAKWFPLLRKLEKRFTAILDNEEPRWFTAFTSITNGDGRKHFNPSFHILCTNVRTAISLAHKYIEVYGGELAYIKYGWFYVQR